MSRQMNILLVEDNSLDAMMIRRALTKIAPNATVVHATDGIKALEALKSDALQRPYFVLLDINMPRMNGIEMVEKIKASGRSVPIVMLTTEGQPELIQRARAAGAKGWIVKPFKPDLLVGAVTKLGKAA